MTNPDAKPIPTIQIMSYLRVSHTRPQIPPRIRFPSLSSCRSLLLLLLFHGQRSGAGGCANAGRYHETPAQQGERHHKPDGGGRRNHRPRDGHGIWNRQSVQRAHGLQIVLCLHCGSDARFLCSFFFGRSKNRSLFGRCTRKAANSVLGEWRRQRRSAASSQKGSGPPLSSFSRFVVFWFFGYNAVPPANTPFTPAAY